MPIPENPLTRGEMFLNAAATGNTSGLPDPKTREEMYLEAIAEGGGGGGTDVVANPTLAGTEDDLTGLQVGDTKYKVGGSSGGGVLVVHADPDTWILDKTWQEIYDASNLGVVVLSMTGEVSYLALAVHVPPLGSAPEKWNVVFSNISEESIGHMVFNAESADSYPSYVGE